jgi:hypothetical protein
LADYADIKEEQQMYSADIFNNFREIGKKEDFENRESTSFL